MLTLGNAGCGLPAPRLFDPMGMLDVRALLEWAINRKGGIDSAAESRTTADQFNVAAVSYTLYGGLQTLVIGSLLIRNTLESQEGKWLDMWRKYNEEWRNTSPK